MTNQTQYTAGPWVGKKDRGVYTAEGEAIFETGCGCCTSNNLSEANARLIAAAPKMLAALERLQEKLTHHLGGVVWSEQIIARDAIKEAKGE